MRRRIIGVMGPGAADRGAEETAFTLGRLIAAEGWVVLTGGRPVGVMDAASRGAKTVDGSITVGILPSDHETAEVSDAVDIAIFTNMGDARNAINVQSSDVVVACGAASPGTLSEVALALKAGKHVVLVNASSTTEAFLKSCGHGRVHVAAEAMEAVQQVRRLIAESA
jgi:uncharacterized protein (TIGR00725 family)